MQIPRFSLRQLTYFVAVAESGSLRAASEQLHVSQTALSQALGELDRELGTTLLARRRAHGATLTAAGARLLGEARAVLDAARDLNSSAHEWGHSLTGRLTVGCYTTLCPMLIPRLFAEYRRRHPGVELELMEGSTQEIRSLLRQGVCDVGLVYAFGIGAELELLTLYELQLHLLLSPEHPLAARPAIGLPEIAPEPFILFDIEPAISNTLETFARAGLKPAICYRTANFELVRSLAARGLGYSMLLQHPSTDLTYEGSRVATRPIAGDVRRYPIALAWRLPGELSRRAREFRALCQEIWPGPGLGPQDSPRRVRSPRRRTR